MGAYGNRVVVPYNMYPNNSFSYSPIKNTTYVSHLNDKLENLTAEINNKAKRQKEQQVIGTLVSLLDNVVSSKANAHARTVTPAPINPEMSQLFQSFQKQQDMMLQLMQNMNVKKEKQYSPSKKYYKDDNAVDMEYQKIKKDPEEIKKMLAELNFNDDGAEDYADKERKLKFNANLTDEEKLKIIKRLEKEKLDRISNKVERTKGISKFRMGVYAVLFPIYIISSLLEHRAKQSTESLKNMENSLSIYVDVCKSWVLKAMKTVLISTINDQSLDLDLRIKESDIRNQSANSKILKLQVRITGIIEGLENLTNEKEMQMPLRKFIDSYISDKAYLPKDTLTGFEISRLEVHEFGGLINQNEEKKKMMVCFFFITKILVKQICMKPIESGIPIMKGTKAFK